jgi:hypothetical protein
MVHPMAWPEGCGFRVTVTSSPTCLIRIAAPAATVPLASRFETDSERNPVCGKAYLPSNRALAGIAVHKQK